MFYELVNLRLAPGGLVSEHVLQFRTLHNQFLSSIVSMPGITVSDHFLAILLLMSLPSSYNSLVQTTLSTSFEKISLPLVYMLLQAESTRLESSAANDTAMATTSKTEAKSNDNKRKQREIRVCSLGHKGHLDDYCRVQLQARLEESEKKVKSLSQSAAKESANLANSKPMPSYYDEAFATGSSSLDCITLDSAASDMMFGNSSLLSNLIPCPRREIGVASKDGAIMANQRGTFKMGGLTLRGVLYSPNLLVNLISAGSLYDANYDIQWNKKHAIVLNSEGKEVITFDRDPNN